MRPLLLSLSLYVSLLLCLCLSLAVLLCFCAACLEASLTQGEGLNGTASIEEHWKGTGINPVQKIALQEKWLWRIIQWLWRGVKLQKNSSLN